MVSTANMLEIFKLTDSSHSDPHHILGMHEIFVNNKKFLAVRAFIPQAKAITLVEAVSGAEHDMKLVHYDGFFETVLDGGRGFFKYYYNIEGYNGDSWTTYDPYAFLPLISEMDVYLFGQGTHYQIYDKLGAHFAEVDGVKGVAFGVWAPNAKRVSVIGSFNGWDGRRHMMRTLGGSGVWELFIPGLSQFDHYKYEIKTYRDDILQKTDPYGSFSELRPSTSSLIYDISSYTWSDGDWISSRNKKHPIEGPINIYEVHLGSWRKSHEDGSFMTYTEIGERLIPYLKQMNYNYVELMPVEEHPFDGSWGYQVTGYYAPTSRYGTPDEFMKFVDLLHQNGIGVILDWVPAHFPKDAHGLAKFDGSALYEHEDPRQGEHPDWGTLIFNYGRNEVKNFLIGNALFWIERYHIDGLRVDAVASMLYLDYGKKPGEWVANEHGGNENLAAVEFMKHMNSVVLGKYPNALMIAEESTAWPGISHPLDANGLGFSLKWNMGWMNDFLKYMEKDCIFRKYHHGELTFSMIYAYTENFALVLSHDEVVHGKGSLINKMPGDLWQKFANLRLALAYMYAHPGKKLLFMGGEFGQFREWSFERELDWFLLEHEHHSKLQAFVKELNGLYLSSEPFWAYDFDERGFEWINGGDHERSLLSFIRKGKKAGDFYVCVFNFTPTPIMDYRVGVPKDCTYKEVLNSDGGEFFGSGVVNDKPLKAEKIEWDGRDYSVGLCLPPLGAIVLKPVKAGGKNA